MSVSHFGGVLAFFNESVVARERGWRGPVVVVRLSPSKMRAESKGVRAGSEAMHSDTRARKQATSTVPLSERSNRAMNRVPGRAEPRTSVKPQREAGRARLEFAVHGAARVQEQLRDQGRARRLESDEKFAHIWCANNQL